MVGTLCIALIAMFSQGFHTGFFFAGVGKQLRVKEQTTLLLKDLSLKLYKDFLGGKEKSQGIPTSVWNPAVDNLVHWVETQNLLYLSH
jgi:hypothetical protein